MHGLAYQDPQRDWNMYRDGLEEQFQKREASHPSDWKSQRHFEISQKITEIINKEAWQFKTPYTYYPDDPYYIMGEFEVGDLSEVEILMDIEKAYTIQFPKNMGELITDELTFEGVIDLVIELAD